MTTHDGYRQLWGSHPPLSLKIKERPVAESKPVISIVGAGSNAQKAAYALVEQFYQRVNERAEKDMLAGNPVTGAHHRALEAEIAIVRALADK